MKSFRPTPASLALFLAFALALLTWSARRAPSPADATTAAPAPPPGIPQRDNLASPTPAPRITPSPSLAAPTLPPDLPTSAHPVERAVADGIVLNSRFEPPTAATGTWTRLRLVQTQVQPRPVRVVETWTPPTNDAATATTAASSSTWICTRRDMYLADQLIVNARPGLSAAQLAQQLSPLGLAVDAHVGGRVFTVRLPAAELDAGPAALRLLATRPDLVESAEIDGVGFGAGLPNDTRFDEQWGLHNTGQSGGVVDADVDAPEFWNVIENTPGIVIAVLDSGLSLAHPDLQHLPWANPGEIAGDGLDNDGNGRIDDVAGWDFVNSDNNTTDDHGHGSNVTGIIAAARDNTEGIAGLIGGVRIVVCKILNQNNAGTTSTLIAATTYARQRGVPIMNMSLQSYPYSSTLDTEFTACRNAGILLCVCAGNQGGDNDASPNYPSGYPHANIIAVGNHERLDIRWSGSSNPSNYGAASVDLFAPGRLIVSTGLGAGYSTFTGTSQATPFVTAVAVALKYLHPSWSAPQLKEKLLGTVVAVPAYAGLCATGGRLNAAAAVSPPLITAQPTSRTVAAGNSATFTAAASDSSPLTYQWFKDGVALPGANGASHTIAAVASAHAGLYTAAISNGNTTTTAPAVLGVASTAKVIGAGAEIGSNIFVAANNNTFDQILLQGPAATITADHAQITRISYVDLTDDIVQVEFSGAGTLSLVLENAAGPASAANYNQPSVAYMKGHAGIVVVGADETTNVAVFSVGRITAVNQALFKAEVAYDGFADLAYIAILSANGKFGGVRTANASYFATKGLTGLHALNVQFTGPVFIGDIGAFDTAGPVIVLGSAADTRITGGDLRQLNGAPVQVSGLAQLKFAAGTTSHGVALPAQTNQAQLLQNGVDVTSQIVANPVP